MCRVQFGCVSLEGSNRLRPNFRFELWEKRSKYRSGPNLVFFGTGPGPVLYFSDGPFWSFTDHSEWSFFGPFCPFFGTFLLNSRRRGPGNAGKDQDRTRPDRTIKNTHTPGLDGPNQTPKKCYGTNPGYNLPKFLPMLLSRFLRSSVPRVASRRCYTSYDSLPGECVVLIWY